MAATHSVEQNPSGILILSVQSVHLTDEQFYDLCRDNPELRFELTARKELVIMSPTGMKTGWRNGKITQRLANWTEQDGTGVCFDSSAGFALPNGAKRSPDAAWIPMEKWQALTDEQKEKFGPLCPDFVVELRSPTDTLSSLQEKMKEYIENGAELGWLFEPKTMQAYIYRPNQPVECLDNPTSMSGDPVLRGFLFDPREIW
jgi:Uma2 family endonuclease